MQIAHVYRKYKIMPFLEDHMLRVAGVAAIICRSLDDSLKSNEVVTACLLHDMGNIIKFDLSVFPESVEPKGLEYWQGVQMEFIKKYGKDEHQATISITKEIGVGKDILELINGFGFLKAKDHLETGTLAQQICLYSDMRVIPSGVVSLGERVEDLRVRYQSRRETKKDEENFEASVEALKGIEENIFSRSSLLPVGFDQSSVGKEVGVLRGWEA